MNSSLTEKVVLNVTTIGLLYLLAGRPLLKRFGWIETDAERKKRIEDNKIIADVNRSVKPDSTPVTPEINFGQFKAYMDKKVYAKYNGVRVRSDAKSNAPVLVVLDSGQQVGFFYSVVGEQLGDKIKTWVMLDDAAGKFIGFVPLTDIRL